MKSSKTFTCIVCPNGCVIKTVFEGKDVISVEGNTCKKGDEYVRQELTDPLRTISTSVRIKGTYLPLCSVRLTRPIPKRDIFRVLEEINKIELVAPATIGQIVIRNVCGLDSDVIATKNMWPIP